MPWDVNETFYFLGVWFTRKVSTAALSVGCRDENGVVCT